MSACRYWTDTAAALAGKRCGVCGPCRISDQHADLLAACTDMMYALRQEGSGVIYFRARDKMAAVVKKARGES